MNRFIIAALDLNDRWITHMRFTAAPRIRLAQAVVDAVYGRQGPPDSDTAIFGALVRDVCRDYGLTRSEVEDTYDALLDRNLLEFA